MHSLLLEREENITSGRQEFFINQTHDPGPDPGPVKKRRGSCQKPLVNSFWSRKIGGANKMKRCNGELQRCMLLVLANWHVFLRPRATLVVRCNHNHWFIRAFKKFSLHTKFFKMCSVKYEIMVIRSFFGPHTMNWKTLLLGRLRHRDFCRGLYYFCREHWIRVLQPEFVNWARFN